MRVTGGVLGGRRILVPQTGVRPTQDRVRAALFSSLAEKVPGARVLDVFAGTGALGLEAWSRGASFVCWIEASPRVFSVLQKNVRELCRGTAGGETLMVRADAFQAIQSGTLPGPFDLILADPPYEKDAKEKWFEKTLQAIETGHALANNGLLVYEQAAREPVPLVKSPWSLVKTKVYGGTRLIYLMRKENPHDEIGHLCGYF